MLCFVCLAEYDPARSEATQIRNTCSKKCETLAAAEVVKMKFYSQETFKTKPTLRLVRN